MASTKATLIALGVVALTSLVPSLQRYLAGPVTLSPVSTTFTPDASASETVDMTLVASSTVAAPSNPADGQRLLLRIKQGGSGSYTITWDAVFLFGTTLTSITLSTAVNSVDQVLFIYDSGISKWRVSAFQSFAS